LISQEALDAALEEQRASGRKLGEILVSRGVISGPAIANALADQHGGLLRTEYGFATGFRRAHAQAAEAPPVSEPEPQVDEAAQLRQTLAEREAYITDLCAHMAKQEEELRRLAQTAVEQQRRILELTARLEGALVAPAA
jgi:hypothetical protein